MGLFTLFKKRKEQPLLELPTTPITEADEAPQDIPAESQGIHRIYKFLQADFELKGYQDALLSPDESYRNDNIKLIKYDLEILIHQVNTYHDSLMKDMEFHIHSRERAGLIDLVDELKIKQTDLLAHMDKVQELSNSLGMDTGLCERAILAYKRGFLKGMASITQAYLLNKKF